MASSTTESVSLVSPPLGCLQYTILSLILPRKRSRAPVGLYEAASIDSATRGTYFWKVSLPLLRPTIVSATTVSIIGSLKYFDLVYVMTGGGPGSATEIMAMLMYKTTFVRKSFGYGAAVA
ncbi:MAG: sugar ABC transporter permease [Spirochaetaceae bacterium]|nr:sugar ABC transporter permease [Spirochaetaceae bacterium]